ncbi:MAG: YihY family inner membrane protein [Myxococcales bacterium]|nr:YihY family inner membrane protein [Myxococcales bacterium]
MWLNLRDRLDALYAHAEASGHGLRRRLFGSLRLVIDICRQLVIDQSLTAAAALAFTTLLSLVPLFAVSFAIFRAFMPSEALTRQIGDWMLGTLLADSVSEVTRTLQDILERARGGAIGLFGFLFLLVTSLSLFMSVEKSFNRIWRVSASRPLYVRLTSFYAVITLSPALVAVGFFVDGWVKTRLTVGAGLLSAVAPWILQVVAMGLMYKLLPHVRVRWRAALAGSIAAAIGLAIMQTGFDFYVHQVFSGSAASQLYGSLSLIPIFFLWMYLLWIIVLAGAEVAYIAQHHQDLSAAVLARRGRRLGSVPPPPSGYLLARLFFEIASHFRSHGGGLTARSLADRLQIELDEVVPALALLKEGGTLLMAEGPEGEQAVPALPLDRISLARLVELGDKDGYTPGELPGAGAQRLEQAMVAARQAASAALTLTVEDLFAEQKP